jgi:hypothetical protein
MICHRTDKRPEEISVLLREAEEAEKEEQENKYLAIFFIYDLLTDVRSSEYTATNGATTNR